jgi:hypothetical protein
MSDQGASYNAISEITRLKEENQRLREDKTELLAELYNLAFDEGVLGKSGALPKWTATLVHPVKDNAMEMAKLMWDAYAIKAGGITFDGKPLPTWDELGEDRQSCWIAAASVTADQIEKLEAALIAIKAMHHDGGVDDVEERDDRTYFIVCEALEATK